LGDSKSASKALNDISGGVKGIDKSLGAIKWGAIAAGVGLVASKLGGLLSAGIKRGVEFNSSIEQASVTFKVLTGSADKARKRVKLLYDYAAKTPFEFPDVLNAGKMLETVGLDIKKWIPIVGDVAAAFNVLPDEVARAVARIKSGDFGEAFERLRDFGISKKMLLGEGLVFDKSGSYKGSVDDALKAIENIVKKRYKGMAEAQSKTFQGMLSTLTDTLNSGLGEAVKPLFDEIKAKLPGAIEALKNFDWKGWADNVERGFTAVYGVGKEIQKAFADPETQANMRTTADLLGEMGNGLGDFYGGADGKINPLDALNPLLKGFNFQLSTVVGQFGELQVAIGLLNLATSPLAGLFGDADDAMRNSASGAAIARGGFERMVTAAAGMAHALGLFPNQTKVALVQAFNNEANKAIDLINAAIRAYNKLPTPDLSTIGHVGVQSGGTGGDMRTKSGGRIPRRAAGGWTFGPKSGYPAILHGTEAVISFDPRYRQQNVQLAAEALAALKPSQQASAPVFNITGSRYDADFIEQAVEQGWKKILGG
jgi:hypothetical protein